MNHTNQADIWLTIREAAAELGVHTTTLRRWADNGDIPFMLTPGGHRRFHKNDITTVMEARHQLQQPDDSLAQVWAEQAVITTRQEMRSAHHQSWLTQVEDSTRQKHRQLGQQLMALTLQYIATNTQHNEHLLLEARQIGRAYGEISQDNQLNLIDALQASMFFRDQMIEVALRLPETTHVNTDDNLRLIQRINTLLNTVHLAIAEFYEENPAF
jgi:excisionase family DNA binding protein